MFRFEVDGIWEDARLMAKKLMVTGYGGFVAGSVVWQALRSREWDVRALSLVEKPERHDRFECRRFDLCDTAALDEAFRAIRPDVVVHAAALADIDYCQNNRAEAERVNVGVTRALADLCAEHETKMIFCSTDTVFDGTQGMYTEVDEARPVNFYAETKVKAENLVRESVEQGVVTRLSLVMGLPVLGAGNSFLAKTLDALRKGESVKFPSNEIRTPLDVITLGRAFLEIAAGEFAGTIHLAGSTCVNRYEMACQIAEKLGFSRDLVVATDSNAMPGRAPRPNDASLDNAKAKRLLETPMQTLAGGLDLVLRTKKEQERES